MLIHITPQIRRPPIPGFDLECRLVDLAIPEFGLALKEGSDLLTRKPYPNKNYFVACRRGRRAVSGLFLETPEPVRQFTTVTRWSLAAEVLVTHRVRYIVLDDDFDAATDNMVHWFAFRDFQSRLPPFARDWAPVKAQPCMDVLRGHSERVGDVVDVTTRSGLIEEREETFRMPTVERRRLIPEASKDAPLSREMPLPTIETAMKVAMP